MGSADALRAMMLQIGKERAAVEARGFESVRRRKELADQWDDLYEDWLLERLVDDDTQTATATGERNP